MSNVKPMKDVKDWPKPNPTKLVKPPPLVRGIGRPKKQRMRAEDENENGHVQKKEENDLKIVRKTQGGIRKAKKKSGLQSGSDAPPSESIVEPPSNALPSESISEPPNNALVRVASVRHEHPKKSQNYGPTLFKAPEHRHTMGNLIRKQGERKKNSTSVLVATRQVVKGAGATFASVTAPFKAPAVMKGTTRNKAQASVTAPVCQSTNTCEASKKRLG
ncbi:hypothetical protein IFM89_018317 [Coptis chinensis]|uniref:Uncharacterized protein n=1 Tax=Coptis chinensis TaxID=261450 RepID=A0A835GWZ2_9MAGN|nr:hypothetical protein IFM89_018317 [Coptis chinensis]